MRARGTTAVSIPIHLDRSSVGEFRAQLANLTRPVTLPVLIQLDRTAQAQYRAQLAALLRDQQVNVNVNVQGDREAQARLARLAQDRRANIRVDVDRGAARTIGRITSAAGSALGMVGNLGSRLAMLGSAAPLIGAVVNVVAAIAPAAAVAVPAVAALGSAMGAIKLGTAGLGEAFKEAFDPAASAASGAASATRQVEQAQRSLADAHRGVQDAKRGLADAERAVGDAQRRAAEQVAQAQRAVADAQRELADAQEDAKRAQEDLTRAYEEGRRALQDLNLQLEGAKLDEEEAVLRVKQAQEELNKVLADPRSSDLDREQARLRFREAQQGLKEQQVETERLRKDTETANKAGIEGTNQVRSAKERLAEAHESVADKARGVRDAEAAVAQTQSDGARQVADAQRGVADAQRRVQDAQRGVADASRALAEAQANAAAQTAKLAENFSKLSPNAQGFVNAVKGLKPAWDSMQLGVQDRLFAGLGGRLTDVGSRVIPILRSGLEGTAGVLNRMAKNALTAVDNLARTGMLKQIFDGATRSLSPLSRIPGQLVTAFGQVAVAAQPAFQRIAEGAASAADGVFAKLTKAFESGAMGKAIDQAVTLLGDLMDVAGNVFSVLGDIFMAGEGTGGSLIQVLKTITEEISKITSSPEVQAGLRALFSVMGDLAVTVAPLLGDALKVIGQIFEKLGPPVSRLIEVLGEALGPIIDALAPIFVELADVLGIVLDALAPLFPIISELIIAALEPLTPVIRVIGEIFQKLSPIIEIVANVIGVALKPVLERLGTLIVELVTQFGDQFIGIIEMILPILPDLVDVFIQLAISVTEILEQLTPLLPQLLLLSAAFIEELLPALLPLVPPLTELVEKLIQLAQWVIEKVVIPAIQKLIDFVKGMREKLQPFIDAVKDVTEWIVGKFRWLYDVLVGHSIIPDLIKKIREWFETGKRWIKAVWDAVWENTIGRVTSAARTVGEKVAGFARSVRDRFNDAKRWATEKWDGLWSGVSGTASSMRKTIEGAVRGFKDKVVGFFEDAVEGVKTAWDKLQGVAKAPVRFLIETVFNEGLRKVWNNTAAKLPGIGKIDAMKLPKGWGAATGGVVPTSILPGYTPGRDVHRFVSPTGGVIDLSGGEAIMRPEVTQVMGRSGVDALNAAARQGGVNGVQALLSNGLPHRAFWGGGIWDDLTNNPVTNAIKKVGGKGLDLLEKGADWARGGVADLAEKTLKTLLGVKSLAIDTKDQNWSKLVGNIPVALADKMVDFIRGKEAETGGGGSWIKPVNAAYGTRFGVKGRMWSSGYHTGLDFPAAVGTAIKAVAAGKVSSLSRTGPYGNHLTVDHGGGLTSLYAHMSEFAAKLRDTVSAGSLLGRVGSTGNTTGPHLHLEARVNGKTVDPMPYLTGGGSSLNIGGSGVQRWAPVVRQALGLVGQPTSLVQTTLRRMNQESGGNPRAVNKWDCLTLDAVILTQRGWLRHDEVRVGDLTIGYNPKTRQSEWTPITRVVHYADAPLIKMGNSRWSATTTPNHRWVNLPAKYKAQEQLASDTCPHCEWPEGTRRRGKSTAGGLRIHLAKAHGIKAQRLRTEIVSEAEWVTTEAIRAQDRLLLAAPADTEASLDISVQEAALLGWIAGDGHIEKQCPTPAECADNGYTPTGVCKAHQARQNPSVSVAQSKPEMVEKLRVLLAAIPHSVYIDDRPTRLGNKAVGPRHVFRIGYQFAQDLLRRAGHPRDNAVDQVLAMSSQQREAWLEAVIDAEGHRAKEEPGKKSQVVIYQRPGTVLDAITLAVYLSGSRPRVAHAKREGQPNWSPESLVRVNNPIVTGHSLKREDAGRGDVWCVTTELGSWTARQDDHIFLTGNSNWRAGHPSVGLMQVIGPTFRAHAGRFRNRGPFLYGTSIDPLANVYSSMRYALSAYGSLSRAYNRPGGYDSGGWLPPGITPVVNQTGKPEAILNPAQWDAMIALAQRVKRDEVRGGPTVIVNNPPQPTGEKQVADVLHRMELLGR
ncbi:peptidoglycan DD-metalloendopeptidase family protein [Streptomyces rochei]|uniref:peptidoglycan DD-metalloendopeptidase family protein n=1 Tax=Streptomyces rochei TaxID=1928 RepID=UPI003410BBC5